MLAPISPPPPSPTRPFECTDADNSATDSYGDDCTGYWSPSPPPPVSWCDGTYDDDDFTPGTMCCACGGGLLPPMPPAPPLQPPSTRGVIYGVGTTVAAPADAASSSEMRCRARGGELLRIATCFFGRLRALQATLPTIRQNLIAPLRAAASGAVDVFVHALHVPAEDENSAALLSDLLACDIETEVQTQVDARERLEARVTAIEQASDGILARETFSSAVLINVLRSRYSLGRVGRLVAAHEAQVGLVYTHVLAARLDTAFLAPIEWQPLPTGLVVANFYHHGQLDEPPAHGGLHDRFAYGDRASMVSAYMAQWEGLLQGKVPRMATSEHWMCQQLVEHGVRVALTPACIVRVRLQAGGNVSYVLDDFLVPRGSPSRCAALRFVPFPSSDRLNGCDKYCASSLGVGEGGCHSLSLSADTSQRLKLWLAIDEMEARFLDECEKAAAPRPSLREFAALQIDAFEASSLAEHFPRAITCPAYLSGVAFGSVAATSRAEVHAIAVSVETSNAVQSILERFDLAQCTRCGEKAVCLCSGTTVSSQRTAKGGTQALRSACIHTQSLALREVHLPTGAGRVTSTSTLPPCATTHHA